MTTNPPPEQPTPPTPPPPQPPRRFLRSRTDRVIAGVCGGLGRYLGVDAVLLRIAFVALVFFGGAGVLLYIAAVLLVPDETAVPAGEAAAAGPPPLPVERNRWLVILGVVLLVLVAGPLLFVPAAATGGILVPLAFLALVGIGIAWLVTGEQPERDARSLLRAAVLGVGVLVLLFLLSIAAFWTAGVGGDELVAAVVIAAGAALVAGAFLRPVRWLILPALAVAIPAGVVAASGIQLDGGIGERTYRPASAAAVQDQYELGIGRLVVDLRGADLPPGDRRLAVDVGIGQAVVVVDEDVCVATDAEIGVGAVDAFDRETGGIDVDLVEDARAPAGGTRLVLDADVGVGHVDVRKTSPPDWDDDHRRDAFRGVNDACEGA